MGGPKKIKNAYVTQEYQNILSKKTLRSKSKKKLDIEEKENRKASSSPRQSHNAQTASQGAIYSD